MMIIMMIKVIITIDNDDDDDDDDDKLTFENEGNTFMFKLLNFTLTRLKWLSGKLGKERVKQLMWDEIKELHPYISQKFPDNNDDSD